MVSITIPIEIDRADMTEVDGVRTSDPRTVVVIGVEHLRRHGSPAAGAAAE
jgi:hypothetical protein